MLPMPLALIILMLKINSWIQCKVLQIKLKLKVLQSKIKLKVLQTTMLKLVKNVPVQPPEQPSPAQPVPTGLVAPAPQVFYQNWIGKKPEFSDKPEEDAESHLLSTRDLMGAHKFPDEVKVRHFCLTLTDEARL